MQGIRVWARQAWPRVARLPTTRRFPLLAGAVAGFAMLFRLLVPTAVGMGDNKDGVRLLCQIGADAVRTGQPYSRYVISAYPRTSAGCPTTPYPTLMKYPLWLVAQFHQHVLGLSGAVDTRELSVLYSLLAGLVIGLLAVLARGLRPVPRLATLLLAFVVLAESTFADYANSPYTETLALWGLAVFVVGAVASISAGRWRPAGFGVAWFGAVLAVGAKSETLTLVLPLGGFLLSRPFPLRPDWPRWTRGVVPALAVVVLAVVAVQEAGLIGPGQKVSKQFQKVNVRNEVSETVMPASGDPAGVATALGLPADWGRYSGSNDWSVQSMLHDPRYKKYDSRLTMTNLAGYFATHPVVAAKVLASGSGPYLTFRTDTARIGNYSAADSQGLDHRADGRIAVVSVIARGLRPVGFPGIAGYWLLCAAGAAFLRRRGGPGSARRAFATVGGVLTAVAVAQYVTSVYGEGHEVTKHMVVALFAATLTPVLLFAAAFAPGGPRRSGGTPGVSPGEPAVAAVPSPVPATAISGLSAIRPDGDSPGGIGLAVATLAED